MDNRDVFRACKNENLQIIKNYLDRGGDIEVTNKLGNTLLMLTVLYGNINAVEILLENGANVDIKNGNTPLIITAIFGYIDIAKVLLENGANTEVKNNDGRTFMDILDDKVKVEIIEVMEDIRYRKDIKPAKR